jgi:uncharacterized 2Fe-2S/4Fe-4S cluster protein (DUF4445 family)
MADRFVNAGGFGQYLNIEKAVGIGRRLDIKRSKVNCEGNSSIAGACMTLLCGNTDERRARFSTR